MAVAATSLLWPHCIMLEGLHKPKAAVKATGGREETEVVEMVVLVVTMMEIVT